MPSENGNETRSRTGSRRGTRAIQCACVLFDAATLYGPNARSGGLTGWDYCRVAPHVTRPTISDRHSPEIYGREMRTDCAVVLRENARDIRETDRVQDPQWHRFRRIVHPAA